MATDDEAPNKGKAKSSTKDRFQSALEAWSRSGKGGIFAPWAAIDGVKLPGGQSPGPGGNKPRPKPKPKPPEKEDPPLPPLDDENVDPSLARPKSNSWPDIVAFNFPKGAGKYYRDGGLVRGGGKAVKGRGRGKMV